MQLHRIYYNAQQNQMESELIDANLGLPAPRQAEKHLARFNDGDLAMIVFPGEEQDYPQHTSIGWIKKVHVVGVPETVTKTVWREKRTLGARSGRALA